MMKHFAGALRVNRMGLSVLSFIYIFCISAYAQTKEYVVLDLSTKEPIPFVNVLYPQLMEGSISNEDGKVRLSVRSDSVVFSHIGYKTKKLIPSSDASLIDTIFLKPSVHTLGEITVFDIDIKEKIRSILKDYHKLYNVSPLLYECTYKEKVTKDVDLIRLSQAQLKWRNKSHVFNPNQTLESQHQMSLSSIDYSKILNKEDVTNTGFVANQYLFKYLHINFHLVMILEFATEINVDSIERNELLTKVTFNTSIREGGETVMYLKRGILYFDNTTNAVVKADFTFVHNNKHYDQVISEENTPYTSQVNEHRVSLSFMAHSKKKLVLSSFLSNAIGEFIYEGDTIQVQIEQDLYITKVERGKKIPKEQQIDLRKPFFDNFPIDKQTESKILLTKKELDFINN